MRALLLLLALAGPVLAQPAVTVTIDGSKPRQTMEGFGSTTISLAYGATDNVPPALRTLANQAAFEQIKLNMGNLEVEPSEAASNNVFAPANDDADPLTLNEAAFNWIQSANLYEKVVAPGLPHGFKDFWLGPLISTNFATSWANAYKSTNYALYLAELAEHVFAVVRHWKLTYGVDQRYLQLWNEPTSGNGELSQGTQADLVNLVKACGARLRAEGYQTTFVVPAQETEEKSLADATAILADPVARQYVGAIAYHPYPYGSTYAAVPNILSSSGAGAPVPSRVSVRNQLRDLGAQYGIPVFMVEVSHAELPFTDFDNLRGRAIHIHDELEYANAAAFFGMNMFWDTVSHAQHYQGRSDPGFWSETDTMVLIDVDAGAVAISPMGRAVGHFARFITRGAVRLAAGSSDPLVLVSAFRDDAQGRQVLVAINDATAARALAVSVNGLALQGGVNGEQSTASGAWATIGSVTLSGPSSYSLVLPARSVTSLTVALAAVDGGGFQGADAGRADAGGTDAGAGEPDAGPPDAGEQLTDAGPSGSSPDAGGPFAASDGGSAGTQALGQCGCGSSPSSGCLALALLLVLRRWLPRESGHGHGGGST